ncbi:MAG: EamA family transporter [Firmicutes bacterium]|nr:EamA family transporter [Bacillota bacterium]
MKPSRPGLACLGLATLSLSTMELVAKTIAYSLHPLQINLWRFAIGSLVLLPLALLEIRRRGITLRFDDFRYFAGLGVLCIVLSNSLFQASLMYSPASTVAVVFCANPVFTVPFAFLFLGEKISRTTILALVLGLAGVFVIMRPFSAPAGSLKGVLLVLASAIVWSLFTVLGKKGIDRYGGIVQNCFTFITGSLALLLLFPLFRAPLAAGITPASLWPLLYLGIVGSGLGFFFYFQGMRLTSASMGSVVFFVKPALAALLAWLLLGEQIGVHLLLGIVLIVAGSVCMYLRPAGLSSPGRLEAGARIPGQSDESIVQEP